MRAPFAIAIIASALPVWACAQENLQPSDYSSRSVMIPMRDGVKLHTVIFAPSHSSKPLPFIFQRTPYGIEVQAVPKSLATEGYILVLQDIRGRFNSEGAFVMLRPMRAKNHANVDESTDAYDTIDWLVKNQPRNNGRVAMLGASYDAWLALEAAADPHPALKLSVPAASPIDLFVNDDFHHNGAFRLSYGYEYVSMMEASKVMEPVKFDLPDTYDWYLRLGALGNVKSDYPTWRAFADHPNHDSFWTDQSVADKLRTPKVPIISVGGWWDQEDPWGPQETFNLLSKNDPNGRNHLVIGPWNHGGWAGMSKLGPIDFGESAGPYYRQKVVGPALLHFLKNRGSFDLPTASVFVTGKNEWRSYDAWPPKSSRVKRLYFAANKGLSFESPAAGSDSYVSDPANPVPYRHRPIQSTFAEDSKWDEWQVEDQRFASERLDVLSYETPPLKSDLTALGALKTHLVASTSGSDSDWVVKLIDEYPADDPVLPGYQLPINMEVVRARFYKGLNRSVQVPPGKAIGYDIDLHSIAHTFLKGHRIMVQVQSTWFPLIDRNPQKFVPNIYRAKDSDFQSATQRIFRSRNGSYVALPIE